MGLVWGIILYGSFPISHPPGPLSHYGSGSFLCLGGEAETAFLDKRSSVRYDRIRRNTFTSPPPRAEQSGGLSMQPDVVIVGAGPAGIFTALEMLKKAASRRYSSWRRAAR